MVMVLHGCRQNNDDMINNTRLKDLAERDNFIVVYPFITSVALSDGLRSPNCWGFFLDQHIHKGAGEVEDLYQIALEVQSAFKIDPQHRYVTGLSSGGGMAVDLAVARSEYFAAAGSVEGLPYSETARSVAFVGCTPGIFNPVSADVTAMQREQSRPDEQRPIPIMAIHARNDCVVNVLGSQNIRDSWISRYGVDQTAVATTDCTAQGVACTQTKYGLPQRSAVETVFYDSDPSINRGYYWVGDNSGQFADPRGPSASELLWALFKSHSFTSNPPPSVSIASASASGTSITVTGSASASGGSIVEVAVRLDGKFPQPQKIASGTSAWTVAFDSLPNNERYVPVVTAKDNNGLTASVTGQPVAVGSPPPNLPPVVSIDNVSVSGDCLAPPIQTTKSPRWRSNSRRAGSSLRL
jgi:poly(hydroxyalkanoate) depolymerase family esterase